MEPHDNKDLTRALRSTVERARIVRENILESLIRLEIPCFPKDEVSKYVESLAQIPQDRPYWFVPADIIEKGRSIAGRFGQDALSVLNRVAVAELIGLFPERVIGHRLPECVIGLYPRQLDRILDDVEQGKRPSEDYQLSNDRFVKDVCICSLRMYVTGARLIEPWSGLPRSLVLRQAGWGKRFTALLSLVFRLGGFRPFFEFHAHSSMLEEFNEAGLNHTYHRVAEFLIRRPPLKGVFGSSWFYDPVVSTVSPRLAYLRRVPLDGGAYFFFGGSVKNDVACAISKSETRRRLYREGAYQPRHYFMVWPRNALIAWHERHHVETAA